MSCPRCGSPTGIFVGTRCCTKPGCKFREENAVEIITPQEQLAQQNYQTLLVVLRGVARKAKWLRQRPRFKQVVDVEQVQEIKQLEGPK